jgi:hypothetical protein
MTIIYQANRAPRISDNGLQDSFLFLESKLLTLSSNRVLLLPNSAFNWCTICSNLAILASPPPSDIVGPVLWRTTRGACLSCCVSAIANPAPSSSSVAHRTGHCIPDKGMWRNMGLFVSFCLFHLSSSASPCIYASMSLYLYIMSNSISLSAGPTSSSAWPAGCCPVWGEGHVTYVNIIIVRHDLCLHLRSMLLTALCHLFTSWS